MKGSQLLQQLAWRKPTTATKEEAELDRVMGPLDLVCYGVGSCVGAGVFVTTGTIAANMSGPSVCLSFIFAGIASGLSALCYAEFAARLPIAGGAYAYAYASMGEMVGWFIGWNATLQYSFSAGSVAVSWANYVVAFIESFGVTVPVGVSAYNVNDFMHVYPLSLVIIAITTAVVLFGANESAKFNVGMTIWNVTLIVFVIIYGCTFVDVDLWNPFMPFGFEGTIAGAGTAFFSYIGLDAVSCMSAETKNPQRDIPIGLLGTLIIAMSLYSVLSLVITGMVPYTVLQEPAYMNAPISQAFVHVNKTWAAQLIGFCSITTLTCTTLCCIMGQPRIFMPMSFDGLLWPAFGRLNKRNVPVFSICVTSAIASFLALFIKFAFLADAISLGTFISFTVCCAGMLFIRMTPICETRMSSEKKVLPPKYAISAVLAYVFMCFFYTMLLNYVVMPLWAVIVVGVLMIGTPFGFIMYIWFFTAITIPPETFKCPLMPFIPLLGIFVNTLLMTALPYQAYLGMLVWVVLGGIIYFVYGLNHSKGHAYVISDTIDIDESQLELKLVDEPAGGIALEKGKKDDMFALESPANDSDDAGANRTVIG